MANKTYKVTDGGSYKIRANRSVTGGTLYAESNVVEVSSVPTVTGLSAKWTGSGSEIWLTVTFTAKADLPTTLYIECGNLNGIPVSVTAGTKSYSGTWKWSPSTANGGVIYTGADISVYTSDHGQNLGSTAIPKCTLFAIGASFTVVNGKAAITYAIFANAQEVASVQVPYNKVALYKSDGTLITSYTNAQSSGNGVTIGSLSYTDGQKVYMATPADADGAAGANPLFGYVSWFPVSSNFIALKSEEFTLYKDLTAPVLSYDAATQNLSWAEVANATSYDVYKNGSKTTTVN